MVTYPPLRSQFRTQLVLSSHRQPCFMSLGSRVSRLLLNSALFLKWIYSLEKVFF